jgi:hypothetical protein
VDCQGADTEDCGTGASCYSVLRHPRAVQEALPVCAQRSATTGSSLPFEAHLPRSERQQLLSSYKVSVGEGDVRAQSLQDAQAIVMEHVTDLLARDPVAAAQGALMANKAFSAGTVAHALDTQGSWQTVITVHGEQIKVSITKRRWWQW